MLFDNPNTNAAYDRWLEPADTHEVDECENCHASDEHQNPLEWFDACELCARETATKAAHAAFEFHFTTQDVERAREWAKEHKYRYESVEHLILDAMRSKVIHTDHWEAL